MARKVKVASDTDMAGSIHAVAGHLAMTQQQGRTNGPKIPLCEEKQRLMHKFVDASHVFMELQSQQTQAVIDGDGDFARFDDLIHLARETKDKAKYSLIAHMEEHCC